MAITFPRAFPQDVRFARSTFTLARQQAVNALQNGAVQAMELGDALWRADFQTEPLAWSARRAWDAWAKTLKDGMNTFVGFDWIGSYPIAYGGAALALTKATGGAWGGQATINAVTATTITLLGLPTAYKARAGDRLSFAWNGSRAYHEVMEDATGSGAGAITLTVEPAIRLNPLPVIGAIVDLIRAPIVMKLAPGTFQNPDALGSQPISFQAVQAIL